MTPKYNAHILSVLPDGDQSRILAAVSGGPDSVAMLRMLIEAGVQAEIAHVHFHLRDADADADLEFVKALAEKFTLPLHVHHADTKAYAARNAISVQMAAREIRFRWFDTLLKERKLDYIALGHNRDDVGETILINLIRGTGIRGLAGMQAVQGERIRPLLAFSREDILLYLDEIGQDYRTDRTNLKTKYTRNKIRHRIIPLMEEINPSVKDSLAGNAQHFRDAALLLDKNIAEMRRKSVQQRGDGLVQIDIQSIPQDMRVFYLFEILQDYGFNYTQVSDILATETSGKTIESPEYRLQRDRLVLLLEDKKEKEVRGIHISEIPFELTTPLNIKGEIAIPDASFEKPGDANCAYLDYDKLSFPLILRRWTIGDRFKPLGMRGFKKISDFLIDDKVPVFLKEQVMVLESGGKIVWLVGYRIDERFKITEKTGRVLRLQKF